MAIVLLLVLLGLFLAVHKPYIFVIYFGLIGSDMGAKGISGALELIYPNYSLVFRILLFIAWITSCINYNKTRLAKNRWIKKFYKISCIYICCMLLALILNLNILTSSSLFGRILVAVCTMGPAVLMIWLSYAPTLNHKKLLLTYCSLQCLIAFLIVYASFLGLPQLQIFNGGLYNNGYYYLDETNNMIALPSNFYNAFLGKGQYFMRCAQFHNANGLGFASGTMLFLLLCFLLDKSSNTLRKPIIIFCMMLVFLLWCNAGTRGSIIGGIIGVLGYIMMKKKNSSAVIVIIFSGLMILFIFLLMNPENAIVNYFLGSGSEESYASRKELNDNTFNHFFDFFLLGNGGDLGKMVEDKIDPHELPLRIFCMYGIFAAVAVTFLTIVYPLLLFLYRKNKITLWTSVCLFISILTGLTNNLTENVLYWMILGEFIIGMTTQRTNYYDNDLRYAIKAENRTNLYSI